MSFTLVFYVHHICIWRPEASHFALYLILLCAFQCIETYPNGKLGIFFKPAIGSVIRWQELSFSQLKMLCGAYFFPVKINGRTSCHFSSTWKYSLRLHSHVKCNDEMKSRHLQWQDQTYSTTFYNIYIRMFWLSNNLNKTSQFHGLRSN